MVSLLIFLEGGRKTLCCCCCCTMSWLLFPGASKLLRLNAGGLPKCAAYTSPHHHHRPYSSCLRRVTEDQDPFKVDRHVIELCKDNNLKGAVQVMEDTRFQVSIDTYAYVLQACIKMKALAEGKQVHSLIMKAGYQSILFLGNILINMYVKCGKLLCARRVFDALPEQNVLSWTIIMSAYSKQRQGQESIRLFKKMLKMGVEPDKVVYIVVLKACASLASLEEGRQIHACIIKNGFETDVHVGNSLIDMYGKCRSIDDAYVMFSKMHGKTVVSWNAMIAGYTQQGYGEKALTLFEEMQQQGMKPDSITFISILKVCTALTYFERGKQVHSHFMESGLKLDVFVGSVLVDMYSKSGNIEDASQVFNKISARDVVLWNAMIAGYVNQGYIREALALFQNMQHEALDPDSITFLSIVKACAIMENMELGKQVHSHIIEMGFESNIAVGNALLSMYAKSGGIEEAIRLFDRMHNRDISSWNTMIAGYIRHGDGEEALSLFNQMQQVGIAPNNFTFAIVLRVCASLTTSAALDEGRRVHSQIIGRGFDSDIFVVNSLVDMYGKCGSIKDAYEVFNKLQNRDLVSWNTMITGYAQTGNGEEAFKLFEQMQQEGMIPNSVTYVAVLKACTNPAALQWGKLVHAHIIRIEYESHIFVGSALVDMYAKCGDIEYAREVFSRMPLRDVVLWNAMIAVYADQGHTSEAFALFKEMECEQVKPNKITFLSILRACTRAGAMEWGKEVHSCINKNGFEVDIIIGNTLIDMYANCGSIENARQVFNKMPDRSIVSWNAMISGYAQQGYAEDALSFFEQMHSEGMQPDAVTYISVLSACDYAGLVDQGCHYFSHMLLDNDITLTMEHFVCIVDLLGRGGYLDEAEYFIKKMPAQFDSTVALALIGACRSHGNVELGKHAFECVIKFEPTCTEAYVLLSNIYGKAGMWDEVTKIRKKMQDADLMAFQP